MVETAKGLTRANAIYQDRSRRVIELQAEGKRVFGYLYIYPVIEMLTALDIVPYRMFGDMRETITKADSYLPTTVCPFLRSCFDLGLKGKYDFLDGVVFAHACDIGERMPDVWRSTIATRYSYFINTPHVTRPSDQKIHKELLQEFQESLEEYTGKKITQATLKRAIKLHNQQRALVRELYDLRKPDPPLISGVETLKVLKAVTSLPVEEGNELLTEVISEVKERKNGPVKKSARLLIWGPVIDDATFVEMIESLDANVVIDDTCVGSRQFFPDVKLTDDPLDGLAYRYLVDLKCARTFREVSFGQKKRDHAADLKTRFGYLQDYAKEWKANGVVLQTMRYCDTHGYEVPALEDYLESIGLRRVHVERDYSEASLAPLKTRVQGLIEQIT